MKLKRLLSLLTIAVLLTGCGIGAGDAQNEKDASAPSGVSFEAAGENKESQDAETPAAADTNAEAVELTDAELSEFTDLFGTPEYKGFLTKPFNDPEDIDLDAVFYYGAGINVENVEEDEIQDYLEASGNSQVYGDLYVMRAADLKEFFEKHLGTSIPEKLLGSQWAYVPKHDSYYYYHWDSEYEGKNFECISGEKQGDLYTLRFRIDGDTHFERFADRVISFTKSGDDLLMASNAVQWDDNCNEEQTFDVEVSESEPPIHFVTYLPDPSEGIKIALIRDGKLLTSISTDVWTDDGSVSLSEVSAVGFFDFNADSIKDILIIGESPIGTRIILAESVPNEYYYEICYGINEILEKELAGNITVATVKNKLLGDNSECRFDDYKAAYAHIARIYNMSEGDYTYGLIDGDGDDVPELVIDTAGYNVSLYSFEKDHLHCLMYHWAYGAMGNTGYLYAPGKGIYYNHNSDYAGAIQYQSYMSAHEGRELTSDYSVEELFFKDTDGDGVPSEEEISATDEFISYKSNYFNHTDKEMSEDEIKAQIAEYDTYQYEEVTGSMSYDEFINSLK